jgi:hypothetical protein
MWPTNGIVLRTAGGSWIPSLGPLRNLRSAMMNSATLPIAMAENWVMLGKGQLKMRFDNHCVKNGESDGKDFVEKDERTMLDFIVTIGAS